MCIHNGKEMCAYGAFEQTALLQKATASSRSHQGRKAFARNLAMTKQGKCAHEENVLEAG